MEVLTPGASPRRQKAKSPFKFVWVALSFIIGTFVGANYNRLLYTFPDATARYLFDYEQPPQLPHLDSQGEGDGGTIHASSSYEWELNMRRARSYSGITVPLNNGYSAKCIPDKTMSEMNAIFESSKLKRSYSGLSDGLIHIDDNLLDVGQVGAYAAANMKMTNDGRPIWTIDIWNNFIHELEDGKDGGPPGYRNSGKSISKAVSWALMNVLSSCGLEDSSVCQMSVFSAISPWAEAILFWSASRLSRKDVRLTSVDFNPCILKDVPPSIIARCQSTLDLVAEKPDSQFDLVVSYSGIEHDGLGRYGDPVNPNGDISALRAMWLTTRPGGVLLLAVPLAQKSRQPKTEIPIWGNGKIQVLQHRSYGAERYIRLLVGWELEGFVVAGRDVIPRKLNESKMSTIIRLLRCSFETYEVQPLLILRKDESMSFDDVMIEGDWSNEKGQRIEEEYHAMAAMSQNETCYPNV